MIPLFLTSTLLTLAACGVAWRNRCEAMRWKGLSDGWQDLCDRWESTWRKEWSHSTHLQREILATKAKRSRAGKIARQAQLDRQRALRDNATAALIEGRAING